MNRITVVDTESPGLKVSNPEADKWLSKQIQVGDKGFVRLVDYMGDDAAIVQAARVSYGAGTTTKSKDAHLINYLMANWHTSPFEMCEIKLHIKMPIYCARQFFRHRTASANEYSMRYSLINDDPEVTNPSEWRSQSSDNKQGSGDFITSWPKEWLDVEGIPRYQDGPDELGIFNKNHSEYPYVEDFVNHKPGDVLSALSQHSTMTAIETYNKLLAAGVAREQARSVLPVCSYTEFYWKQNLHNLFHLLRLRLDPHAQLEIREFATAIAMIVEDWVPMTYKAFEEHRLESVQFSKSAIQVLRDLCTTDPEFNTKLEGALESGVQSKTELRNIKGKIWSK